MESRISRQRQKSMEAEQTGPNPGKAWAMDLPVLARPGKPGRL